VFLKPPFDYKPKSRLKSPKSLQRTGESMGLSSLQAGLNLRDFSPKDTFLNRKSSISKQSQTIKFLRKTLKTSAKKRKTLSRMKKMNETNLLSLMLSNDSLAPFETRKSKSKSREIGKTLLKDYMGVGHQ